MQKRFFFSMSSPFKNIPSGYAHSLDLRRSDVQNFSGLAGVWRWGGPAGGASARTFPPHLRCFRQNALFQIQIVLKAHAYMAAQADCRRRDGPGVLPRPEAVHVEPAGTLSAINTRSRTVALICTPRTSQNAAGASADLSGLLSACVDHSLVKHFHSWLNAALSHNFGKVHDGIIRIDKRSHLHQSCTYRNPV